MKKAEVIQILANGNKAIVRSKMTDGRYFATKDSDEYTVLCKVGDAWTAVNTVKEAPKNDNVIILNDCKDAKTGSKRTIAVNDEYMGWALGTGFSFEVAKGKTSLSLKTFTKAELKEMVAN
jgi:hypothetical protein